MDKTNEKHFGLRVDGDILAKFRYVCGLRRGKPAPHADNDAAQRVRYGYDQLHGAEPRRE